MGEHPKLDEPLNPMDYVAALHAENQRRLTALEDRSEEILVGLTRIVENTKDLPELAKRVDALESSRDTATSILKTGLKMLGWAAVPVGGMGAYILTRINWSVMFR